MRTIGIDLAAEPRNTAAAAIEWSPGAARLTQLRVDVGDAELVAMSASADVIGIDCPFGWPVEFVDFVAAIRRREATPREFAGKEWRQRIRFRETDRFVHRRTGRWPLSVATDLLSLAAMHGAELLEAFERDGVVVDRTGAGRLVEVYPAASLRRWGLHVPGYKRDATLLRTAADRVRLAAGWLQVSEADAELMARSDDALDAVVACLTARARALGRTEPVPDEHLEVARSEGWIALPDGELGSLVSSTG